MANEPLGPVICDELLHWYKKRWRVTPTQAKLASAVGISCGTMRNWMKGGGVTADTLRIVHERTGISYDRLYGEHLFNTNHKRVRHAMTSYKRAVMSRDFERANTTWDALEKAVNEL